MLTAQTELEKLILGTPRHHSKKLIKCSAARQIQDVKRNVPFRTIVANFGGKKKESSKNQKVAKAKGTPKFIMPTKEATEKTLRRTETSEHESKHWREMLKKIREQLFQGVDTKYLNKIREMFAFFAYMWSESLERIDAIEHHVDLTKYGSPFRSASYRSGPSPREPEEQELQNQLKADLYKLETSIWASPVQFVAKKDRWFQFCIDYRSPNESAIKDTYPFPRFDECINSL